jgi:hypothetical protein
LSSLSLLVSLTAVPLLRRLVAGLIPRRQELDELSQLLAAVSSPVVSCVVSQVGRRGLLDVV